MTASDLFAWADAREKAAAWAASGHCGACANLGASIASVARFCGAWMVWRFEHEAPDCGAWKGKGNP